MTATPSRAPASSADQRHAPSITSRRRGACGLRVCSSSRSFASPPTPSPPRRAGPKVRSTAHCTSATRVPTPAFVGAPAPASSRGQARLETGRVRSTRPESTLRPRRLASVRRSAPPRRRPPADVAPWIDPVRFLARFDPALLASVDQVSPADRHPERHDRDRRTDPRGARSRRLPARRRRPRVAPDVRGPVEHLPRPRRLRALEPRPAAARGPPPPGRPGVGAHERAPKNEPAGSGLRLGAA